MHQWHSTDGRSINARLMGFDDGKFVLRREGQKKNVLVPFDRVTTEDQEYARSQLSQQGLADRLPPRAAGAATNPPQLTYSGDASSPVGGLPGTAPTVPPVRNPQVAMPQPNTPPLIVVVPQTQPMPTGPHHGLHGHRTLPSPHFQQPGGPIKPQPVVPQPVMPQPVVSQPVMPQPMIPQPLMPPRPAPPVAVVSPPPPMPAPQLQMKEVYFCQQCKAQLPDNIKAGDYCPKCGAWFSEVHHADGKVEASSNWFGGFRFMGIPGVAGVVALVVVIGVRLGLASRSNG